MKLPFFSSEPVPQWGTDGKGITVGFTAPKVYSGAMAGRGAAITQLACLRMQLLLEQGYAEACEIGGNPFGIFIE